MAVRPSRRRARGLLAAAAGLLVAVVPTGGAVALPGPVPATPPAVSSFTDGTYVVSLVADPLATYDGSLPGLPQLKAAPGGGVDLAETAAARYRAFLLDAQSTVADLVDATPLQRYTVALNGFTARLTAEQAAKLSTVAGVLAVTKDRFLHPVRPPALTGDAAVGQGAAATTADFLGLTGENGVWNALGGVDAAGAGLVVADIDTGLWPEHPSVAGEPLAAEPNPDDPYEPYLSDGVITMTKADGSTFTGTCETGEGWTAANCSTKVVAARTFSDGFTADEPISDTDYASARDVDGHGTHTATTAVGRAGVRAEVDGVGYGDITGIAPAAALAVYKPCWTEQGGEVTCVLSDTIAAIEAAVADGADVINYSLSDSAPDDVVDPLQLAFLSAASAGIFIAASAGNDGPDASTVLHNSPWVTSVASATSVLREGTVVLRDGTKFVGARLVQQPLGRKRMVLASTAGSAGVAADDARLCLPGTLDPHRARGRVVICDRGESTRLEKSAEVERAGGAGLILVNTVAEGIDADAHSVPTVHLDVADGAALKAYVAAHPRAGVRFEAGNTSGKPTATPQSSGFSSRGPSLVNGGDVLKPDVTAPGSSILAGFSPEGPEGAGGLSDTASGTSMSAPHVAGLAALVLTAHPDWSPMAVKSALMTTATSLLRPDGTPEDDPFLGGAGFVDPRAALDPGLVYDSTPLDWLDYIEGSGWSTGTGAKPVDPSDLNQASIGVGGLVGTQTVTRSVTATTPGLFHGTASVPGFDVEVSPSILSFDAAGETEEFRVTFTRTTAPTGTWATGALTWRGADLTVRSPLAVEPVEVAAPAEVSGSGSQGSLDVTVTAGSTGDLDVRTAGLAEGVSTPGSSPEGGEQEFEVQVPEGGGLVRFDVTADDPAADLDLEVYRVADDGYLDLVATSAGPTADEQVTYLAEEGTYVAFVSAYATPPGADTADYTVTSYVVTGDETTGGLTVGPNPVPTVQGRTSTFSVDWTGLDPGGEYLGALYYGDVAVPTVLRIGP